MYPDTQIIVGAVEATYLLKMNSSISGGHEKRDMSSELMGTKDEGCVDFQSSQ